MNLGNTTKDTDLLIVFVIRLIRTSILSLTRYVCIGLTAQKALDDLLSNYLISFPAKA